MHGVDTARKQIMEALTNRRVIARVSFPMNIVFFFQGNISGTGDDKTRTPAQRKATKNKATTATPDRLGEMAGWQRPPCSNVQESEEGEYRMQNAK